MSMAQDDLAHRAVSHTGFSASEGLAGLAAIVLAILGLAGVVPLFLVAIATIAIGVAMALKGAAVAGAVAALMTTRADTRLDFVGGSAWSLEFFSGLAGIILGVLALLQIHPAILVAVALIGFGGGLTMSSTIAAQLSLIRANTADSDNARSFMAEAASGAAAIQALSGLTAVVLGILSLAGFSSTVLVLIGLLALGSFVVMNGGAFGSVMVGLFRR